MEIRYGILTIGKEGTDYMVCAGNLVERSDVERLRAKLSRIRDMSKDELKALDKEQLEGRAEEGAGRRPRLHGDRAPRLQAHRVRFHRR